MKNGMMNLMAVLMLLQVSAVTDAADRDIDLSISTEYYMVGGLFIKPFLPVEGEETTITVRANLTEKINGPVPARVEILDRGGKTLAEENLPLTIKEITRQIDNQPVTEWIAEADWKWSSATNGLFKVRAILDPDQQIQESDESNNQADIDMAVIIKDRQLYFPWYYENQRPIRWGNIVTTANSMEQRDYLTERGVKALIWQFGGMSWTNHDGVRDQQGEEDALKQIEEHFRVQYTNIPDNAVGYGIDEIGGYPDSWFEKKSAASMKALQWAKRQRPDLFYAVWHAGGTRDSFGKYFRDAADLVMLEIYIWDALPRYLHTEEIYKLIRNRVEPYYRNYDMMVPTYGSPCHTVVALDVAEAVDLTNLGELEEVVRFIRREFPELRGQGWYSGALYKNEKGELNEPRHQEIVRFASDLNLKYYIKPCLTLMEHSLWLERYENGTATLTAAVSNIGAMDAGPLSVEFFADGKAIGQVKAGAVPAGPNRNENRTHFSITHKLKPGAHRFEARIQDTDHFSTVLVPTVSLTRFVE